MIRYMWNGFWVECPTVVLYRPLKAYVTGLVCFMGLFRGLFDCFLDGFFRLKGLFFRCFAMLSCV